MFPLANILSRGEKPTALQFLTENSTILAIPNSLSNISSASITLFVSLILCQNGNFFEGYDLLPLSSKLVSFVCFVQVVLDSLKYFFFTCWQKAFIRRECWRHYPVLPQASSFCSLLRVQWSKYWLQHSVEKLAPQVPGISSCTISIYCFIVQWFLWDTVQDCEWLFSRKCCWYGLTTGLLPSPAGLDVNTGQDFHRVL